MFNCNESRRYRKDTIFAILVVKWPDTNFDDFQKGTTQINLN